MAKTMMTCPHCNGTGKAPLDQAQEEMLATLSEKEWRSTQELYGRLKITYRIHPTAANNRLTALRCLGFAKSERRGKKLFWKRIK